MRSLSLEMAQIELQKLGFNSQILSDGSLVIPKFKRYAEQDLLKEEGAPFLDGEGDYHNYVYPNGIISGFNKIEINKDEHNRIQSIVVPRDCLPQEPNNSDIESLIFQIQFVICEDCPPAITTDNGIVTIVLNGNSNSHKVLDLLISRMVASAQEFNPEKNYVSHIGRLIPIVVPYLSVQIRQNLLYGNGKISLLNILVDRMDKDEIDLVLPAELIKQYIEKICRENQKLVEIVDAHLQIRQTPNFMQIDADGIRNPTTANKIRSHVESKKPLYIATTTGLHAFAVMIDCNSSTLFVANPGDQVENFANILDALKDLSGCTKVVRANTTILERSDDIDINDTCTADALSLVCMMRQHNGQLSEGCLNRQCLRTGEYAWKGLAKLKEVIAARALAGSEPSKKPSVNTQVSTQDKSVSKSLDKKTLKDCLAAYRPNSWAGIILFIITFGYHRSETIKALDALCDKTNDDEMISLEQMITVISQETCVDSRKQHRINFFNSTEPSDCSGTDQVIQSILNQIG